MASDHSTLDPVLLSLPVALDLWLASDGDSRDNDKLTELVSFQVRIIQLWLEQDPQALTINDMVILLRLRSDLDKVQHVLPWELDRLLKAGFEKSKSAMKPTTQDLEALIDAGSEIQEEGPALEIRNYIVHGIADMLIDKAGTLIDVSHILVTKVRSLTKGA